MNQSIVIIIHPKIGDEQPSSIAGGSGFQNRMKASAHINNAWAPPLSMHILLGWCHATDVRTSLYQDQPYRVDYDVVTSVHDVRWWLAMVIASHHILIVIANGYEYRQRRQKHRFQPMKRQTILLATACIETMLISELSILGNLLQFAPVSMFRNSVAVFASMGGKAHCQVVSYPKSAYIYSTPGKNSRDS